VALLLGGARDLLQHGCAQRPICEPAAERVEPCGDEADRRKLDEYLYAIRDIEQRIQRAERDNQDAKILPSIEAPPSSIPEHYTEHARLMFDLMIAAFQTDSTRIITFLMAIEQSNRNYREIDIPESHHGLTHHGGDKDDPGRH